MISPDKIQLLFSWFFPFGDVRFYNENGKGVRPLSIFPYGFINLHILDKTLNCAALNVIWNLIGGNRFEYDDPKMQKLIGTFLMQIFCLSYFLFTCMAINNR